MPRKKQTPQPKADESMTAQVVDEAADMQAQTVEEAENIQAQTVEEADMQAKTEFSLKGTTPENNAYRCTLGSCAELSIYEVNEMLVANGYLPFGSSPAE